LLAINYLFIAKIKSIDNYNHLTNSKSLEKLIVNLQQMKNPHVQNVEIKLKSKNANGNKVGIYKYQYLNAVF
jgi:hypothetical protein